MVVWMEECEIRAMFSQEVEYPVPHIRVLPFEDFLYYTEALKEIERSRYPRGEQEA